MKILLILSALGVFFLWFYPPQAPQIKKARPLSPPIDDAVHYVDQMDPVHWLQPKKNYQSIKDEPIFFESRRRPDPYVPPPQPKPKPVYAPRPTPPKKAPSKPHFKLIALTQSQNQWHAYVQKDQQIFKLKQGETIGDWRLTHIRPDQIELSQNNEKIYLSLRNYAQSSGAQSMRLLGITVERGIRFAYMAGKQGTLKLRPGQLIDGWQLRAIKADKVWLKKGQKNKELALWQYTDPPQKSSKQPNRPNARPSRRPRPISPPRK